MSDDGLLSRRAVLAGVPAAAVAVPAGAAGVPPDPVLAALAAYDAAVEALHALPDDPSPADEHAAGERLDAAELVLLTAMPATLDGLARVLERLSADVAACGHDREPLLMDLAQCRGPVGDAARNWLARLARAVRAMPGAGPGVTA